MTSKKNKRDISSKTSRFYGYRHKNRANKLHAENLTQRKKPQKI